MFLATISPELEKRHAESQDVEAPAAASPSRQDESDGGRAVSRPGNAPEVRNEGLASRPPRALPHPVTFVLVATVYFLAGKVGLALAFVHASASAVWPSTGIALAALLTLGFRYWPAIFVAAFLVNATTFGSLATSFGIAAGNTLEALVGAILVRRFANGTNPFHQASDTFRFVALAGMVATTVSPTIGVTSLALAGFAPWVSYGSIWLTWWLGDMGGALIVAPVLLLWSANRRVRWSGAQSLEAVLLLASLVVVGQLAFGGLLPLGLQGYPLAFVCMPLLIWAAFRFDPRMAATAILVVSTIAVWGTVHRAATLERGQLNESLLLLQVFMGVTAVTTLAMAVEVSVRRRAEEAARAASIEVREAMTELEAFSHSISHDLRSPIGAVLNCTAIIEEDHHDGLGPEGMRLLRQVRVSAESSVRLLDEFVQFAWVGREGGGEKSIVDMTRLAREAFAQVITAEADAGEVRFELAEMPRTRGNAALLSRVFYNLFSNAVKFSRGRPNRRVEVFARGSARESTYCVADNGIGFDPRYAGDVFLPFRRLRGTERFEGSGLGLAIVSKIVRKHGGSIWAESDGTSGARFSFTLPNQV